MDASIAVVDLATGVSVKRPVIHDKGVLKAALVGKRGTKFVVTASSGHRQGALFNPDSSTPVESYLYTGHTVRPTYPLPTHSLTHPLNRHAALDPEQKLQQTLMRVGKKKFFN